MKTQHIETWDIVKTVLREKCIDVNVYIDNNNKKGNLTQINWILHLKEIKSKQITSKASKTKEIIII